MLQRVEALVASDCGADPSAPPKPGAAGSPTSAGTVRFDHAMAAARHPTAFVTWAHSGDGWTDDNARAWADEIRTFCIVLRGLGIDVEADVFHFDEPGINWDHFGPRAIADRDFTIVAASVPWKERWDGRNDPRVGAGAVAEANQLHGMFARDQQQFAERVVIVELPMAIGRGGVPDGLSGVPRFEVREVSLDGLELEFRAFQGV